MRLIYVRYGKENERSVSTVALGPENTESCLFEGQLKGVGADSRSRAGLFHRLYLASQFMDNSSYSVYQHPAILTA